MDNDKAEREAKVLAVRKYVEKSSLPFIICKIDKNAGKYLTAILGTGTLFKFLNKYFIVTAGHVIIKIKESNGDVGIPINKNRTEVYTLKDCKLFFANNENDLDIYDVGIIELTDELGKDLELSYFFLDEHNISFTINKIIIFIFMVTQENGRILTI